MRTRGGDTGRSRGERQQHQEDGEEASGEPRVHERDGGPALGLEVESESESGWVRLRLKAVGVYSRLRLG